jgi:hypothetical protein
MAGHPGQAVSLKDTGQGKIEWRGHKIHVSSGIRTHHPCVRAVKANAWDQAVSETGINIYLIVTSDTQMAYLNAHF